MLKRSLRLFMLMTALVSLVGVFGTPIAVEAAHVGPTQCVDTKANCQKNKGGQNGQAGQTPVTTTPAQSQACSGFSEISGVDCSQANGGSAAQSTVGSTVSTVVGFLSLAAGILGVFFIMLSGFRYITSGGDQNRVASAKTTLLYALAGLAVAALSQILIHTVLSTAAGV
jgi:hypothetical protein